MLLSSLVMVVVHETGGRLQTHRSMTMLAEVVAASKDVTATSSRSQKIATLAGLLASLEPDEVAVVTGFLSGAPRQGRVGIGYSTIYGLECEPAAQPSLAVRDVDAAVTAVQETTGSGSAAERRRLLVDLL